jgi:RNA polymerase sigma factor (sigma-70 family)
MREKREGDVSMATKLLIYKAAVEKGFSVYIKLCLQHVSRDYFTKFNRDLYRVRPLDEMEDQQNLLQSIPMYNTSSIEEVDILSDAIQKLNFIEKKILYLKYIQDKTDKDIAYSIGVTRQAISKSRTNALRKLKIQLESQF